MIGLGSDKNRGVSLKTHSKFVVFRKIVVFQLKLTQNLKTHSKFENSLKIWGCRFTCSNWRGIPTGLMFKCPKWRRTWSTSFILAVVVLVVFPRPPSMISFLSLMTMWKFWPKGLRILDCGWALLIEQSCSMLQALISLEEKGWKWSELPLVEMFCLESLSIRHYEDMGRRQNPRIREK